MLSCVFPVKGYDVSLSKLYLLYSLDAGCLSSLSLQTVVSLANMEKRVVLLGKNLPNHYISVHGSPAFQLKHVDFIEPIQVDSLEELEDKLNALSPSTFHADVIVIDNVLEIVGCGEICEDRLVAKCFALLRDCIDFFKEQGHSVSIIATASSKRNLSRHLTCPKYITDMFVDAHWSVDVTSRMTSSKLTNLIGSQYDVIDEEGQIVLKFRYSTSACKFSLMPLSNT